MNFDIRMPEYERFITLVLCTKLIHRVVGLLPEVNTSFVDAMLGVLHAHLYLRRINNSL